MKNASEWVSPNKFASHVGVSAQAVFNAIEGGRFTSNSIKEEKTKKGKPRFKINLKLGTVDWNDNRKGKSPTITDEDYQQARRSEQLAKAKLAELDAKEREGELVDLTTVSKYHGKLAAALVTGIENEITRIAPSLINISSVSEIEIILRDNLMGHFEEFSRGCEGKGPYSKCLR